MNHIFAEVSAMVESDRICIIGLGYVGLPLAVGFAEVFEHVVGFDLNPDRVAELKKGIDKTHEVEQAVLSKCKALFSSSTSDIRNSNCYIVAVPTPITTSNVPDLTPVIKATEMVASVLKKGDLVVYESTVYPGVTEEVCLPILVKGSGLKPLVDFKVGYSPERINPGDKEHTLKKIVKVVAGQDEKSTEKIAEIYGKVITAGVFKATSIQVAEAAKVIENTQRDLNIALMNELALIFDRMNIRTADVLQAANTKWNFLNFTPGLVGGHCIGVDPYYLTYKAESLGYNPQVILAGRRINNYVGTHIAQKAMKLLIKSQVDLKSARVGILGLTFKENVPDTRNSKVPLIYNELAEYGITGKICDPMADQASAHEEYGLKLCDESALENLDLLIFAVPHKIFLSENALRVTSKLKKGGILIDVKSAIQKSYLPAHITYWSL
jgi:UDP-N-acetyl-D-galactosamine dehydrogenase